jgi:hypothetical protein
MAEWLEQPVVLAAGQRMVAANRSWAFDLWPALDVCAEPSTLKVSLASAPESLVLWLSEPAPAAMPLAAARSPALQIGRPPSPLAPG